MAAKNTNKKRKTSKKTVSKKRQIQLSHNTISMILFFSAVLFGIFIYTTTNAVLAAFFHNIVFGLFAKSAYIVPVALAVLGIFVLRDKSSENLLEKSVTTFFFVVSVSGLIHTLSGKDLPVVEFYTYGIEGIGGGLLGGILSALFLNTIGKTAAIIIFVFAVVTLLSHLLEVSIVTAVSNFVSGMINDATKKAKKSSSKGKNHIEKEKIEKEPLHKIKGIDFSIDDDNKKRKASGGKLEEDIEKVIFTPSPDEPIQSVKKEKSDTTAQKAERVAPITTAERDVIHSEIDHSISKEIKEYKFPPISLLKSAPPTSADKRQEMRETAQKLMEVLSDFNVEAKLLQVTQGPSVTRYEIQPETGVKLSKITGLSEDIAWKLAVPTVLVAAVPGKAAVGIEVPNNSISMVSAREIIDNSKFKTDESKIAVAFGKDIGGNVVIGDIAKMPHILIAGATGSGKSVCVNTIITSILYKATPDEVKLIMIDPKVVELAVYNGIPHLLIPVVTDPKRAAGALNWAVQEMKKRYDTFAATHVRNLEGFNKLQRENGEPTMPKIVIIIDELADLMMVAAKEVEDSICRLAQLARAAGIHLIIATQRPSVDVITGLIKANVPSRIAFAVSSQVDSRTILDRGGAEKLLGKGDMLYYPSGMNTPIRVQGAFVSDGEIEKIVKYVKDNSEETHYSEDLAEHIERCSSGEMGVTDENDADDADELLPQAIELAVELGQISTAMIQRRLKVGYARAGRIIDQMEARGIISGANGSKPREVYTNRISMDDMSDLD